MGKDGTKEKKRTDKSYRPNGTQSQTYYTTQEPRRNGKYLPMKGTGNGQDGNGGDEGRDDKRKLRNSKYDFEDKKDEESDTEDFCELQITPKQLSQVVPGGGVLKIKLSKKKPIKISAEAPMESLIQLNQRLKLSMILQIGEMDNQYQIQSQV